MTVGDLLVRADSWELTEWQVLFEQKRDEELYFHEHPRDSYSEYLDARDRREEHARRAGQLDTTGDDDDGGPDPGDDDLEDFDG